MRLLLLLREETLRNVCHDYYAARGCDVDLAENAADAEPLLRFREYDLVLADVPSDEFVRLHGRSRPVRVLLTTDNVEYTDESLHVLTKPQPLDAILSLVS